MKQLKRPAQGGSDRVRVERRAGNDEVERLVQSITDDIWGDPVHVVEDDLSDERAVGIAVRDVAPFLPHLEDVVLVPRVGLAVAKLPILVETVRNVDAKTVYTSVEPEPQDRSIFGVHLLVAPVEIGLRL